MPTPGQPVAGNQDHSNPAGVGRRHQEALPRRDYSVAFITGCGKYHQRCSNLHKESEESPLGQTRFLRTNPKAGRNL